MKYHKIHLQSLQNKNYRQSLTAIVFISGKTLSQSGSPPRTYDCSSIKSLSMLHSILDFFAFGIVEAVERSH
jgi:hypothetical protein